MQEAFVAALLVLARKRADDPSPPADGGDGDKQAEEADDQDKELVARLRRSKLAPRSVRSHVGVADDDDGDDEGWMSVCASDADQDLDELELWVAIKKQVEILREGMGKEE